MFNDTRVIQMSNVVFKYYNERQKKEDCPLLTRIHFNMPTIARFNLARTLVSHM
jgi:hypothetical protein